MGIGLNGVSKVGRGGRGVPVPMSSAISSCGAPAYAKTASKSSLE